MSLRHLPPLASLFTANISSISGVSALRVKVTRDLYSLFSCCSPCQGHTRDLYSPFSCCVAAGLAGTHSHDLPVLAFPYWTLLAGNQLYELEIHVDFIVVVIGRVHVAGVGMLQSLGSEDNSPSTFM